MIQEKLRWQHSWLCRPPVYFFPSSTWGREFVIRFWQKKTLLNLRWFAFLLNKRKVQGNQKQEMENNLYEIASILRTAENKRELQEGGRLGNETHHKQVDKTNPVPFFKHKNLQNMHFTACVRMQSWEIVQSLPGKLPRLCCYWYWNVSIYWCAS